MFGSNNKKAKFLLLVVISVLISITAAIRCYQCHEAGLIKDVKKCSTTINCHNGCKVSKVNGKSL